MAGSVPKMDKLIDTVEAVEIVDGVRARLTAPWVIEIETVSDSIIDGGEGVAACVVRVSPLVGEERFVGVGVVEVIEDDGDDGVSEGIGSERPGRRWMSSPHPGTFVRKQPGKITGY
jgi:hypothetical protein